MNGIYHKIGIRAHAADVVKALTTQAGLAGWWTREVTSTFAGGASALGDSIHFRFGETGAFDMKVKTLKADRVTWECTAGPEDWIGSHVDFDLKPGQAEDGAAMTLVHFRHQDWKTESDFTAHCSMKWAGFQASPVRPEKIINSLYIRNRFNKYI